MIRERRLEPELMDQPDLDPSLHRDALRGLRRINVLSRSAAIVWPEIAAAARRVHPRKLRVLDLACGGGDNAIALALRGRQTDAAIDVHGCDISPVAIEVARQQAQESEAQDVDFFTFNVLEGLLPAGYDVVTCSLFLHHLNESQASCVLAKMAHSASDLVLVNDLQRSWLGLGLAWVGCHLLTRSTVVHTDGPRSVAAAFAVSEIGSLAAHSGLEGATITQHWPQRWLLSWRKH
jgi:2-polyprenyl-3-methyl-5-hydroxy-6-metoxy-1,4-benzoquinol methylase